MKDSRKLILPIILILLTGIITTQIGIYLLSHDFKRELLIHDAKVAGYLSRRGLDASQISSAFTQEKTTEDLTQGEALLQAAGYHTATESALIPEAHDFYRKYAIIVLFLSIAFSCAVFMVLLFFAVWQDRKLTKATATINKFMDGDYRTRLNDNDEGSLAKLFASINALATSFTAHIIREKQNKEFLRDTIADISHQLKTPLAALKMYNEIIQDENNNREVVANFTAKSGNELDRMEYLIQNLLKLARLDAGTIELDARRINVRDFLTDGIKRFHTRAEKEKKSFVLDCDPRVFLSGDESWLLEAVSNILKNALDHTAADGRVEIRCEETPVMIRITIRDNGRGIHPEDLHHIFKRFYRSRFSQDKQGIGIGLTLAKSIVEKHGGVITVESEPGKGTAFMLAFPKLTIM